MTPDLKARRRDGGAVCAYCHDGLGAEPTRCEACGAEYHADCRAELGRCATVGCTAGAPTRTAPAAPPPRIEGVGQGMALTMCLLAGGIAGAVAVIEAVTALATGTRSDSLPNGPWPALCAGSLFLCFAIAGLGLVARETLQALRRRAARAKDEQDKRGSAGL